MIFLFHVINPIAINDEDKAFEILIFKDYHSNISIHQVPLLMVAAAEEIQLQATREWFSSP